MHLNNYKNLNQIKKMKLNSNDTFAEEKNNIITHDIGCYSLTEVCDYPIIVKEMHKRWITNARGILICGSGIGMSIAANRFSKFRAALCTSENMIYSARQHNDVNILVLSAQHFLKIENTKQSKSKLNMQFNKDEKTNYMHYLAEYITAFLYTDFELSPRHIRRVQQLSNINL